MKNLRALFYNLLRDDSAQDMIEYALVAGLIALGAITAMTSLGTTIATGFTSLGTKVTAATN